MTRPLLVAVIVLGLAAGLGILMVRDPGYLGVAYGGWLFESSLWLGLLGLALLAFVLLAFVCSSVAFVSDLIDSCCLGQRPGLGPRYCPGWRGGLALSSRRPLLDRPGAAHRSLPVKLFGVAFLGVGGFA